MKTYTTNYQDAFIEVADDCPVLQAEIPPLRGGQLSQAGMQYAMLQGHPYEYTSDEVLFACHAARKDWTAEEEEAGRAAFFSRGQACLRASPLAKRYGFGIHHDAAGRVAIYGRETAEYQQFCADVNIKKVKAMRSKRA